MFDFGCLWPVIACCVLICGGLCGLVGFVVVLWFDLLLGMFT